MRTPDGVIAFYCPVRGRVNFALKQVESATILV